MGTVEHAAVQTDDAGIAGGGEGRDDGAGMGDRFRRRREDAVDDGDLIGMDGTGPGANSSMMRLESADLTVYILTNLAGEGVDPEPFRDEIFRLVLNPTS